MKKKLRSKKILSLFMSGAVAASLLAGCGSRDAGSAGASAAATEEAATESAAAGGEREEEAFAHDPVLNEPGAEPLCREQVVITIGIPANTNIEDYDTNYYTLLLEEKANVDIQFVTYTSADATEKLRVQIAGGEKLPDIILWGQDEAEMMEWGADGYFIPLEQYFENSAYYTTDIYADYQEKGLDILGLTTTSDGHIWQFPGLTDSLTNPTGAKLWVYEPWLEAVGMTREDIADVDGFYEMLVAFKTQDPNGNGVADEIPLMGSVLDQTDNQPWVYLMNAFQPTTVARQFLVSENGQLSASFTTDEFKEGVKYISRLVQEGLYDPVSFTQDNASFRSILNAAGDQLVGCFAYTSTSLITADHPSKNDWILVDPLIGADGYCSTAYAPDIPVGMAAISADCEHPEVAFRLMDLMCSEYMSIVNRYGEEGVNWMYAEDAKEEYPDADWSVTYGEYPPYILDFNSVWNTMGNAHWMEAGPHIRTAEISGGYFAASVATGIGQAYIAELAEHHDDYMAAIPAEPITKIQYASPDEQTEAAEIYTELYDYVTEMISAWFTGTSDVEADWNTYLDTLEEIGLSDWLELNQKGWG